MLHARTLLESTDLAVETVARDAGFGSAALLRHHFTRCTGITPTAFRTQRRLPGLTCAPSHDLHTVPRATPAASYARSMTEGTLTAAAHILVVEDEPLINQAVTDRLRAEGFVVEQAHDGPGAVAAFEEYPPDLVVLDLMLPASTGWRCAAASRPSGRYRCSCSPPATTHPNIPR